LPTIEANRKPTRVHHGRRSLRTADGVGDGLQLPARRARGGPRPQRPSPPPLHGAPSSDASYGFPRSRRGSKQRSLEPSLRPGPLPGPSPGGSNARIGTPARTSTVDSAISNGGIFVVDLGLLPCPTPRSSGTEDRLHQDQATQGHGEHVRSDSDQRASSDPSCRVGARSSRRRAGSCLLLATGRRMLPSLQAVGDREQPGRRAADPAAARSTSPGHAAALPLRLNHDGRNRSVNPSRRRRTIWDDRAAAARHALSHQRPSPGGVRRTNANTFESGTPLSGHHPSSGRRAMP
jgi:hypothetical protein